MTEDEKRDADATIAARLRTMTGGEETTAEDVSWSREVTPRVIEWVEAALAGVEARLIAEAARPGQAGAVRTILRVAMTQAIGRRLGTYGPMQIAQSIEHIGAEAATAMMDRLTRGRPN